MVAVGRHDRTIVGDGQAAEIDWGVGRRGVDGRIVVDDAVCAAVGRSRVVLEIIKRIHRCRSSLSLAKGATVHLT